jgi:hypothetical protein
MTSKRGIDILERLVEWDKSADKYRSKQMTFLWDVLCVFLCFCWNTQQESLLYLHRRAVVEEARHIYVNLLLLAKYYNGSTENNPLLSSRLNRKQSSSTLKAQQKTVLY